MNLEVARNAMGSFGFLLNSVFWIKTFVVIKTALASLTFVLMAASVFVLIKMWPLRHRLYVREGRRAYKAPKKKIDLEEKLRRDNSKKWDSIIKKTEGGGAQAYPLAIIEADILLENAMGQMGFLGKNLAERLRTLAPGEISSLNDVWEAHKLRNKIAHEPDFHLDKEKTTKALDSYKKALEDLRVI